MSKSGSGGDRDGPPIHSVGSPAPGTDPVADEIAAEITDHLATAADELQQQGLPPAAAQQKAQEHFGDPAVISRRCYWIKQGDTFMFRAAVIGLFTALCLALAITSVSSWRSQRQMAEQMTVLAEQLKQLADQQKAPVASTEPKPLEIAGRAFFGSPDKPAANTRITILDVKDASHVRSVGTDREGNFNSGPLGGGDYALLAETGKQMRQERYPRLVQSAPIGVYPGVPVPKQDFDIACQVAALAISTSRPLAKVDVDNRYTIDSRLMMKIYSSQNRSQPWITEMEPPDAWPVYPQVDAVLNNLGRSLDRSGKGGRGGGIRRGEGQEYYDILKAADLEKFDKTVMGMLASQLPAGKVEVAVAILTDVYPIGYVPPPVPEFEARGQSIKDENRALYNAAMAWKNAANNIFEVDKPISLRSHTASRPTNYSIEDDNYYWLTKGLGHIWLAHLRGAEEEQKPRRPHLLSSAWLKRGPQTAISLPRNCLTRIQVVVPDDLESRVRELVDGTTDPNEFAPFVVERLDGVARPTDPSKSPFFSEAKLTVMGTEPLAESVEGSGSAGQ